MLGPEEGGERLLKFVGETAGGEPEVQRGVDKGDHLVVIEHAAGVIDIGLSRDEPDAPLPEPVDFPDFLKYFLA